MNYDPSEVKKLREQHALLQAELKETKDLLWRAQAKDRRRLSDERLKKIRATNESACNTPGYLVGPREQDIEDLLRHSDALEDEVARLRAELVYQQAHSCRPFKDQSIEWRQPQKSLVQTVSGEKE